MTQLGTEERPLRVAIVGAGPSGFYAADALFKSDLIVHVDAIDRLPCPYGLLRGGVAPDHQQMKSVEKFYARVAEKNAESFGFIGNVAIGQDISIEELQQFYDAIIFSYGAESDKKTGLDGEELDGNFSAREFVGWYNGHPDYVDYEFNLDKHESVVIIGQGNVAVDVARILAKTQAELGVSDIAQHAQDALKTSTVKDIYMIGRRGPVQAAFTQLEIKELGELEDCDIYVNPKDLELTDAQKEELEGNNKATKNYEVLTELSQKEKSGKSECIHVCFYHYPNHIRGSEGVEGFVCDAVQLEGEPHKQKAVKTGESIDIDCGLIFRSIGYKGTEMPGVPFRADWGIIPNDKGRVLTQEDGDQVKGLYTAGWIKRGPTGVLGTNKPDATETVEALIEDVTSLTPCSSPSTEDFLALVHKKGIRTISFDDWKVIDAKEIENGQAKGKPREKFVTVDAMIEVLG